MSLRGILLFMLVFIITSMYFKHLYEKINISKEVWLVITLVSAAGFVVNLILEKLVLKKKKDSI